MGAPLRSIRDSIAMHSIPEPNSGCHLWVGALSSDGYPVVGRAGRQILVGAFLVYGCNPVAAGLASRHKCDNKICVNEQHLKSGTHSDNVMDRVRRDRSKKSKGYSAPRLKRSDVEIIREMHATGEFTFPEIASRFAVTWKHIKAIVRLKRWT